MTDQTNKEKMIEFSINNYENLNIIKDNINKFAEENVIKDFFWKLGSFIVSTKCAIDTLLGDNKDKIHELIASISLGL